METSRELASLSHAFGPAAARGKVRLLAALLRAARLSAGDRAVLESALQFMRAYPDTPEVLALARRLAERLPDVEVVHPWSYGTLHQLARRAPGTLHIEWEELERDHELTEALALMVSPAENQGLEDITVELRTWVDESRSRGGRTDLEYLLDLVERSPYPAPLRAFLLDNAEICAAYRGPSPARLGMAGGRPRYQKAPLPRASFPLEPAIRRKPRRITRAGREILDLSLQALCARALEIYPLCYANPSDIFVVSDGLGIQVAIAGALPQWRGALETICFVLVLKNGVPIAYGPASTLLGSCELGINLFPEFRGGETRHIYAKFMQALHHHLGVEHFFLTRYGMGVNNPEAIKSGAFWFYRKLGFTTTNPDVEKLAREEEARMAARPSHRSDRRMLRRLSRTEAHFDLSEGRLRRFDTGRLGMALSRHIETAFGGDRRLAERRSTARLGRVLGVSRPGRAFQELAPLFGMIPDLESWSHRDRSSLAAFLRAKDAPSEARAARMAATHPRLGPALHRIAEAGEP